VTGDGEIRARSVVVATGDQNVPRTPALHQRLPGWVVQRHTADYPHIKQDACVVAAIMRGPVRTLPIGPETRPLATADDRFAVGAVPISKMADDDHQVILLASRWVQRTGQPINERARPTHTAN
jgi:hypothetical protein